MSPKSRSKGVSSAQVINGYLWLVTITYLRLSSFHKIMNRAVLLCLLAQAAISATCEACELCPKGRVYPIEVECGASKTTTSSKLSEVAHNAYNLLASTEVAAAGLLSVGASSLWSALFGRKRNVQMLNKFKTETTTGPTAAVTQTALPTTTELHLIGLKKRDKEEVVTELAHSRTVSINGLMCRDGTHGLSETVPIRFCNATSSFYWRRGHKVIDHCSDIPPFTAIAAFHPSAVEYSHESISGVFISCTDNEIQIATEDCTNDFSVLHIINQSSEKFTHDLANYYTIQW